MTNLIERKDKSSLSWLSYPHGAMFLENRDLVFADLHLIHEWEVGLVYTEINKLNSSSLRPGHPATFRLFSQVPKQRHSLFMHCALLASSQRWFQSEMDWVSQWEDQVHRGFRVIVEKKSGIDFLPSRCPECLPPHVPGVDGECAHCHDRLRLWLTFPAARPAEGVPLLTDKYVKLNRGFSEGRVWKQLLGLP